MTDMSVAIDGHPADIHLHLPRLYWDKSIFFSRERIIDVYGHLLHATSLANGWKNIYFMGVLEGYWQDVHSDSRHINLYVYIWVVY
jgi:hypothetical protein